MKPTWETTDGAVKLYLGDALCILPELPEDSIDAVITDPPYSSGGMFRGDRSNRSTREKYQSTGAIKEHATFTGDNRDQRGWQKWMALWLIDAAVLAKPGAMLCCFTDWRQLPVATDAIQAGGWLWMGIVPWDKVIARPQPNRFRSQAEFILWGTNGFRNYELMNARYHDGVFAVTTTPTEDREHATQKPVELMEKLVLVADEDGIVLDPFMGSGTTGVAAVRAGRGFVGIEKEAAHFETAKCRITAELNRAPLFEPAPAIQSTMFTP